ncbi:MAG: hypothetical protein JO256_08415 [Alphaproteobacteria bacterium]|nr:hypothetical protein [Alphaproteobacteria bacterium]
MRAFQRALGAAAVTALLASSATADVSPLPAGKPAGVRQADLIGMPFLLIGLAIVGIIVAVSASGGNTPTTPTTGTGS